MPSKKSNKRGRNKQWSKAQGSNPQWWYHIGLLFFELIHIVGLPGAILFYIGLYVYNKATEEQNKAIIDKYILFEWEGNYWYILIPITVLVLVFWGQHIYNKKKLQIKDKEIDRLVNERNKLQEKLIEKKLHHSDP